MPHWVDAPAVGERAGISVTAVLSPSLTRALRLSLSFMQRSLSSTRGFSGSLRYIPRNVATSHLDRLSFVVFVTSLIFVLHYLLIFGNSGLLVLPFLSPRGATAAFLSPSCTSSGGPAPHSVVRLWKRSAEVLSSYKHVVVSDTVYPF